MATINKHNPDPDMELVDFNDRDIASLYVPEEVVLALRKVITDHFTTTPGLHIDQLRNMEQVVIFDLFDFDHSND